MSAVVCVCVCGGGHTTRKCVEDVRPARQEVKDPQHNSAVLVVMIYCTNKFVKEGAWDLFGVVAQHCGSCTLQFAFNLKFISVWYRRLKCLGFIVWRQAVLMHSGIWQLFGTVHLCLQTHCVFLIILLGLGSEQQGSGNIPLCINKMVLLGCH